MKSLLFIASLLVSSAGSAEIPGTGIYVETHDFSASESRELVKTILAIDPKARRSKTDLTSLIRMDCFRNSPQCFYQLPSIDPPARPHRLEQKNTVKALFSAGIKVFGVNKYWNKIRAFGFERFHCKYVANAYRCRADVSMPDLKGKKRLTQIQVGYVSYYYISAVKKLMQQANVLCSITFTNIKANIENGDQTYVCPVPFAKLGFIDNWMQLECMDKKNYKKATSLVKKSYFSGQFEMPVDSLKKPIAKIRFNSCVSYLDTSGIVPTRR